VGEVEIKIRKIKWGLQAKKRSKQEITWSPTHFAFVCAVIRIYIRIGEKIEI
jgi:hypothetical protein